MGIGRKDAEGETDGIGGVDLGDGIGISWDSESLYLDQINIKYSPWPEAGLFFFLKAPCCVSS